jgi:hypothetical protein
MKIKKMNSLNEKCKTLYYNDTPQAALHTPEIQ